MKKTIILSLGLALLIPKLFLGPVKSRSELALKTKLETAQKMPETQNKNVKDGVEAWNNILKF